MEAELSPDGLPPGDFAVVAALDFFVHEPMSYAPVGEINDVANKALAQMGEELRLKDRKVGAILTGLGFPRRQRGGDDGPYQLELNMFVKDLVHRLVKFYGTWNVQLYSNRDPRVMCALCREHGLVSDADLRWYEMELKPAEERRKREEEEIHERRMEQLRKNPPRLLISGASGGRAVKSE